MPGSNPSANSHWSQWWSEGHITSFGTSLVNNYEGATRDHWRAIFAELDGDNVLDIATGNGALATLAVEFGEERGRSFKVSATDLADIGAHTTSTDPRIAAWREKITFVGATPCEHQPFDSASFDAVLSQYGFEYSDIDATLAEVYRLLRPGGRFLAISHHAGSGVVKRQQQSARVYHAALEQLKLFRLLERHLDSWGKARNKQAVERLAGKPKFQKSYSALESALRQFASAFPNDETAARVFCAIDDLRNDAYTLSPSARSAAVASEREHFMGTQARLADLFAAALNTAAIERIKSRASEIGYSEAVVEPFLEETGTLAGWSIRLTR
ncbi:class I SAM-dependent methyltransferase [Halioglobus maricola]|uniref:Class I SAM-dependent methyltransferase n=1 Tax=Halioglobus maricola TaxID=2601894 RepID=A0A5P9NFG2_9GAMM|nr:class I SAM-dependent methyltransferase [Halioglobus maricola]QFU74239.1 class I SAM-dependent methyltransferase [Halioglobus maricola]